VESSIGNGTQFRVLLPASGQPATIHQKQEDAAAMQGKWDATVLVVDDEDIVRRTARHALEHYGYRVLPAANGREAIQQFAARAAEVDVVLLDLTMPGMSGEETLRELKRIRPDVKVVLSSGYNEAEATERFAGHDLAGFLQKPYAVPRLAEAIRVVLDYNEQTRGV
jgi:CheY-like chemotaxis protein